MSDGRRGRRRAREKERSNSSVDKAQKEGVEGEPERGVCRTKKREETRAQELR